MPSRTASILGLLLAALVAIGAAESGLAGMVLRAPHATMADGALRIDTRASTATWIPCALTAPGRLAAGRSYLARVTCRIDELGDDAFLLLLIRPARGGEGRPDLATRDITATGKEQTIALRFTVPAGQDDWALQIHTRKRLLATVTAITITERQGEVTTPFGAAGTAATLPRLATGAQEFTIDQPRPTTGTTVSVTDFGADTAAADNVAAFNKAIAHCKTSKAAVLTIPAGTYRFTSDTPLTFDGLEDFTCDGKGSTLVFLKKRGEMLRISACRRTLFKDVALDWDWERDPLASVVTAETVAAGHLDFRFTEHRRFPRREVRVADIEQLDPATMSVGCEDAVNAGFEFRRGEGAPRTEWLGDDLLRVFLDDAHRHLARQVKPGMPFRMRHYVYDMVGVAMRDNTHLTLSGITVHSCPSHAFVSDGEQHHWQFLRTHIVPPTGAKRSITCTADHHHIGRSQGFFKMEGCEFSLGGDDCLNVHDITAFAERTGPRTLRTRNCRNGQTFRASDPIELRRDDYAPTGVTAPLVKLAMIDAAKGVQELTFDRDLPDPAGEGFILFNRRFGSRNVIVRDCHFHNNRARGLLLLTDDVTVEGCRFVHNQMGAIKIETGYTFNVWSEGYGASNIVIRNNRFENVNPMGAYRREMVPTIYMSVYLRTDPSEEKTRFPILHDILVEGNTFSDGPGAIAYVCSAQNVVIRNNRIENSTPRRSELPYRGWIGASYARDLFVTGNTWTRSPVMPTPSLRHDPETCGAIHQWGNTVR